MSADRADEENLKTTSFTKGEWIESEPIALAMDYDLVAETFATAGVPLATITPLTLTALAYVTGGLDSALMKRPDDLLTEWEAAITARGAQAGGGDAATNARATAEGSCTSDVERMAVRLVEAKDGVMQLVSPLRELPHVQAAGLNVQPFKRLVRLADAHGSMPTASIRSLATRLGVSVPDDNDSSETARAKWVWQLALLERSVTIRALGYLKAAQADGKWDATVVALGDTGRFTAPWMAAAKAAKAADGGGGGGGCGCWCGVRDHSGPGLLRPRVDGVFVGRCQRARQTVRLRDGRTASRHAVWHAVRRVEDRLRNGYAASDAGAKPRSGQVAGHTGDDTRRALHAAALHDADGRRRWSTSAGRKPGTGVVGDDGTD